MVKPQKLFSTPIFIYNNYVDFLQDWSSNAKKAGITQKEFIRRAGIKSHAFFSDVLAQRKVLGRAGLEPFISALGLRGDEAEYFRLLVKRHITKSPDERAVIFNKLMDMRKRNLTSVLEDDCMEYFTDWKFTVIREYILAKGLVKSPKEIAKNLVNLKLKQGDVKSALSKLESWRLIAYDKQAGGYRITKYEILAYRNLPHVMLNDIKRKMIETSIHAMEILPKEKRDISMAIRGLSKKNYHKMCQKINQIRQDFLNLEDEEETTDQVLSLNVQFFPVARLAWADNERGAK